MQRRHFIFLVNPFFEKFVNFFRPAWIFRILAKNKKISDKIGQNFSYTIYTAIADRYKVEF